MKISPTQLDKFKTGPRKWAWEYLEGHKQKPTDSLLVGTEVHRLLEEWFGLHEVPNAAYYYTSPLTGKQYPAGKSALHMLSGRVPNPKAVKCVVESAIGFSCGDIDYNGRCDLSVPTERQVWDHKTSSDPAKWAKTPEALATDSQALIYAKDFFMKYTHQSVEFILNYGRTDGKGLSKPIQPSVVFHRGIEFEKVFAHEVHSYALQVQKLRAERPNILDVPCNTDACGAFGGCPFTEQCNFSAAQRIGASFMRNSLLDELKAAALAVDNDDETTETAAEDMQLNPEPQQTSTRQAEMLARLQAKKSSVAAPAATPAATPAAAPAATPATGGAINALQRLKQRMGKVPSDAPVADVSVPGASCVPSAEPCAPVEAPPAAEAPATRENTAMEAKRKEAEQARYIAEPPPSAVVPVSKKAPVVEMVECPPVDNTKTRYPLALQVFVDEIRRETIKEIMNLLQAKLK